MFNRKKKLSWWQRVWAFFVGLFHRFAWNVKGAMLDQQLANPESQMRTEAQKAIDRVVYETHIPPDCVAAMIFRGAPNIQIKHDPFVGGATATMINGENYNHAAERAVEWINAQGELTFHGTTAIRRQDRRAFDKIRRKRRRRH